MTDNKGKKQLTLSIVHQHPKILLGMKKRGFGEGRWNGFGGKLEKDESLEDAMHREMKEEAGVAVIKSEKVGILAFDYKHTGDTLEVHLFRVEEFSGEPKETEEMKPQWFYIDEIPFKEMWPDDRYWVPLFLKGKKFKGTFVFNDYDTIVEHNLEEVESI